MQDAGRGRLGLAAGLAGLLLLGACAAAGTAVAKRQLDVQTRMTASIFLDPAPPAARTVYVEVKNTSDRPELDLAGPVRAALQARGYRLVDDPAAAHFMLQANVLQAGRNARTAAEAAYRRGPGSAVSGAVVGGAAGYGAGQLGGNSVLTTIGGALAGAAASVVGDAYVQDVDYSIITDLQVSERAPAGTVVSETESARLPQGGEGTLTQSSSQRTDWRRYRTRIVSTAERVNLDWPQAAPQLTAGLTRSIAGIF